MSIVVVISLFPFLGWGLRGEDLLDELLCLECSPDAYECNRPMGVVGVEEVAVDLGVFASEAIVSTYEAPLLDLLLDDGSYPSVCV